MMGPSLQKTAALSVLLHVTFIVLIAVVSRKASNFVMPSPYVVRLVSPSEAPALRAAKPPAPRPEPLVEKTPGEPKGVTLEEPPAAKAEKKAPPRPPAKEERPDEGVREYKEEKLAAIREKVEQERYLSDRMSAIRAKRKLERIAKIRQESVSVGALTPAPSPPGRPGADSSILNDYYLRVQDQIWQNWVFPDTGVGDIEAVIAITVMKDGSVRVNGFERSSGNPVFDRSAMRAVEKASPLEPPPFKMDIGVRFHPYAE
jgi:colicin import membrane protein